MCESRGCTHSHVPRASPDLPYTFVPPLHSSTYFTQGHTHATPSHFRVHTNDGTCHATMAVNRFLRGVPAHHVHMHLHFVSSPLLAQGCCSSHSSMATCSRPFLICQPYCSLDHPLANERPHPAYRQFSALPSHLHSLRSASPTPRPRKGHQLTSCHCYTASHASTAHAAGASSSSQTQQPLTRSPYTSPAAPWPHITTHHSQV